MSVYGTHVTKTNLIVKFDRDQFNNTILNYKKFIKKLITSYKNLEYLGNVILLHYILSIINFIKFDYCIESLLKHIKIGSLCVFIKYFNNICHFNFACY
jgi:hypothetical protein